MSSILLAGLTLALFGFGVLCAVWALDLNGKLARRRVRGAKRAARSSHTAAGHTPGRPETAGRGGPAAAGSSARAHWNPRVASRRGRDENPTYRAHRSASPDDLPKWDPYAEEQSRIHRIRAARGSKRVTGEPDYYELLGLERTATDAQIEQAYRRYVAQIHPDRFFEDPRRRVEAERKMRQLNAVMEVLRDPLRRARYDAGQDKV